MQNEQFEYLQYNSCVSRGICSLSPQNSAIQTVLVLYLRLFAKYAQNQNLDEEIKYFILNTVATTLFNPEFNEKTYLYIVSKFKEILPKIFDKYFEVDNLNNLKTEKETVVSFLKQTSNFIDAIKYGEKSFFKAQNEIKQEIRDFYSIILIVLKSISINLLDLKSFDKNNNDAFKTLLELFSIINLKPDSEDILKEKIYIASNINIELTKLLRQAQEERYGKQQIAQVSYSTIPKKAVLVVGSNIRELENILEALKEYDIDIYTHDEMMLAYTFPKFLEYENLRGQFGEGIENCLLDFSTFPGPIILTKHSLHNIENFYRGRLFTTDYMTSPKGIIKIENNNFTDVIDTAKKTKGFKKGRQCEIVGIGYNYDEICQKIKDKLAENHYSRVFIISLDDYSLEKKTYFENLINHASDDTLILSFSYNAKKNNLIHINTCFDNYSWLRFYDFLKQFHLPISIFIPKCERDSISQMIYLSKFEKTKIFISKCKPIIINPSMIQTLGKNFDIKETRSVKRDLNDIYADK